jgi:hypothetical protein
MPATTGSLTCPKLYANIQIPPMAETTFRVSGVEQHEDAKAKFFHICVQLSEGILVMHSKWLFCNGDLAFGVTTWKFGPTAKRSFARQGSSEMQIWSQRHKNGIWRRSTPKRYFWTFVLSVVGDSNETLQIDVFLMTFGNLRDNVCLPPKGKTTFRSRGVERNAV